MINHLNLLPNYNALINLWPARAADAYVGIFICLRFDMQHMDCSIKPIALTAPSCWYVNESCE